MIGDTYHPADAEDDEVRCAVCGKSGRAGDMDLEEVMIGGPYSKMLPVCKECQS
jgi:hypothetical protein